MMKQKDGKEYLCAETGRGGKQMAWNRETRETEKWEGNRERKGKQRKVNREWQGKQREGRIKEKGVAKQR